MDVTLNWSGEWPEFLGPLLNALEALPEADDVPDGDVCLCPDASQFPPPAERGARLVAFAPRVAGLAHPEARTGLLAALAEWTRRDAILLVTTPTAAEDLRAALRLPADRVRVLPLPLPAERIPPEAQPGGDDVLVLGPPVAALATSPLLRVAGLQRRYLLAAPDAEAWVRPGGLSNHFGLLGGHDVCAAPDWHEAIAASATVVLTDCSLDDGWTLREALASGRPVVVPSTPAARDHLAAAGAAAYAYEGSRNVPGLAVALVAALRGDRGEALAAAARESVLSESWSDAARVLLGALHDAVCPTEVVTLPRRVAVTGERLSLCVINPRLSTGGGERFMRELVEAMGAHASSPRVKLVCAAEPHVAFHAGARGLMDAGVEVVTAPLDEFQAVAATEFADANVVYCSWVLLSEPPDTPVPLACTFHDVNWRHFDVLHPPEKALIERQAPLWIDRCAAIVHSSQFIREEVRAYYGAPPERTHVIPTATEPAAERPSGADRKRVRHRFALPVRFLLSPNGFHLHKNYSVLEAALRLLRADGRPVPVAATGVLTDVHYHGPDLIGLGYVDTRELAALYAECDGVVQTTLYEAGSFPMGEAMAAGKPVAISRIAPVVEQVERVGLVAELFDPLDPLDVAEAIWRVWSGSSTTAPEVLAANAAAVARRTWDDVATDYLQVLAAVARAGGRPLSASAR